MKTRIMLRAPSLADEREFLASARRSRASHRPRLSAPQTAAEFRAFVRRVAQSGNRAFLICRRDTDAIVGIVNRSTIVLGLFRSGYLGYYAFAARQREGLMAKDSPPSSVSRSAR